MAKKIIVQDGNILYAASDSAYSVNMGVEGQLNVTKQLNVGDDPLADGLIATPVGTGVDLILRTYTDGFSSGNIKFEPVATGKIVLNNVVWPDGAVSPVPGMYLGVSSLNTLQFYTLPTGAMTIKTIATDYTLQVADAFNTLIRITKATPATVTIENDGTVSMPIGSRVTVGWNGVGSVTIFPAVGVTIDTPETLSIKKQYGKVYLIKVAANHWEIEGNLLPI